MDVIDYLIKYWSIKVYRGIDYRKVNVWDIFFFIRCSYFLFVNWKIKKGKKLEFFLI